MGRNLKELKEVVEEITNKGASIHFEKDGCMGIYFLENGACARPSVVVYDRENSCIAGCGKGSFN